MRDDPPEARGVGSPHFRRQGGYPRRGPTQRAQRWNGSRLYRQLDGGDAPLDAEGVADLRARAGDREWTIAVGGWRRREDWDEERARIAAVAEAGADWWLEFVPAAERDAMREAVRRGPLSVPASTV